MKKILFLAMAFFTAFLAFAGYPPDKITEYSVGGQQWHTTANAACSAHFNSISQNQPAYIQYQYGGADSNQCKWSVTNNLGGFTSNQSAGISTRDSLSCGAGLKLVGDQCEPSGECQAGMERTASGSCVCKKGTVFDSKLGMCQPQTPCNTRTGQFIGSGVQLDYGSRSADRLGRMVGSTTSGCHAASGCVIQGTVAGCWGSSDQGGSGCMINTPTYTGASCSETDKQPQLCPQGSKPSEYAAGVCIPDENKCPAGSRPSQYAAGVCIPDQNKCPAGYAPSKYVQDVCVPEDDKDADGNGEEGKPSKCPAGYVESRYVAGICVPADTTVGGGGGGTSCKDGKCTTTDDEGNSDEESQDEFCKKNPDNPQCKKNNFGGSCGTWTCEGDAIQCAIAKEQHKTNCKLFDEKSSHPLTQAALDGSDEQSAEKLKGKAEQISVGTNFNQAGFGWAKGCPADAEIPLGFVSQSFSIPFSRICGPLEALSLAGVGITLLGCLVWVIGGKKA